MTTHLHSYRFTYFLTSNHRLGFHPSWHVNVHIYPIGDHSLVLKLFSSSLKPLINRPHTYVFSCIHNHPYLPTQFFPEPPPISLVSYRDRDQYLSIDANYYPQIVYLHTHSEPVLLITIFFLPLPPALPSPSAPPPLPVTGCLTMHLDRWVPTRPAIFHPPQLSLSTDRPPID